jgi:hypothetical protein
LFYRVFFPKTGSHFSEHALVGSANITRAALDRSPSGALAGERRSFVEGARLPSAVGAMTTSPRTGPIEQQGP